LTTKQVVETLDHPNQFASFETFTQTGFKLYSGENYELSWFQHNQSSTLFCFGGVLFKTYSEIDIIRM
jgi:hypothetical protein